jgi:hypothetical protein
MALLVVGLLVGVLLAAGQWLRQFPQKTQPKPRSASSNSSVIRVETELHPPAVHTQLEDKEERHLVIQSSDIHSSSSTSSYYSSSYYSSTTNSYNSSNSESDPTNNIYHFHYSSRSSSSSGSKSPSSFGSVYSSITSDNTRSSYSATSYWEEHHPTSSYSSSYASSDVSSEAEEGGDETGNHGSSSDDSFVSLKLASALFEILDACHQRRKYIWQIFVVELHHFASCFIGSFTIQFFGKLFHRNV